MVIRIIKFSLLSLLSAGIVILALSNRDFITMRLYGVPYEVQMPLFMAFFMMVGLGILLAWVVMLGRQVRLRRRLRKSEQRAVLLEQEIAMLKIGNKSLKAFDV